MPANPDSADRLRRLEEIHAEAKRLRELMEESQERLTELLAELARLTRGPVDTNGSP